MVLGQTFYLLRAITLSSENHDNKHNWYVRKKIKFFKISTQIACRFQEKVYFVASRESQNELQQIGLEHRQNGSTFWVSEDIKATSL